ncbi:hypothetical protein QTL95_27105 [Rhizobium sp. S152]|uniref:hypothetical protein n=1 Tax=Rhizobium sp. S152 TaxID=3055038 RepID=UPI0025A9A8CC|nr:hypothetical protein [Rhizobium sp. S152]MDM9629558.1 hypothetical protein [Rhizobium sp. S152]
MEAPKDPKEALLALLGKLGVEPGSSINLYEIGPPMVADGFIENDIVNALYALKDEGVIDLPGNNRLLLVRKDTL